MPALYSHTTRSSGTVLTAAIYNADHVNHITNGVPAQLDDYSATATEMRTVTDPGESGTESLATTLAGELERIRYTILEMKTPLNGGTPLTYWYQSPSGSVAGTVADDSISNAKLRNSAALSVIGRSANSSGDPADIAAANDGEILRRSGTSIGFGTIPSTSITGLGTSATVNTGTSGAAIPLLNGNNTHSGNVTFSGTVDLTSTAGPSSATAAGYLGIPLAPVTNANSSVTLALSDAGRLLYHTATPHTHTIPANASVAFPIGTVLSWVNEASAGDLTIAINSDTLRWKNQTGSRTLASNGVASAIKVDSTVWRITGNEALT